MLTLPSRVLRHIGKMCRSNGNFEVSRIPVNLHRERDRDRDTDREKTVGLSTALGVVGPTPIVSMAGVL